MLTKVIRKIAKRIFVGSGHCGGGGGSTGHCG